MKRLLLIPLLTFTFACRESPTPESQAVTTAETTTTQVTTSSPAETALPAPAVQGPKLAPVDEAGKDPSLVAFREELLAAVRSRNADAVIELSDPKIRTSFGDGGGSAALRTALKPGVWENFELLLSQGGSFQGESFWAPYVYSAWPDAHDAFTSLAITGENIPLRESRDAGSRVIATLSRDIVQRAGEPGDQGEWQQVKTADGHTGWVEARYVSSPVGYRAGFLKNKEGKWQMNALVAGD
ncbi:MAG TPA: SH3 domain-containing protein [Thermoanaerobaculia bacterium]|jgi:SH3-like domain-containing protein|nr:SH3 domain-containing protein [Thermoanaerobaculia bacterium]